MSSYKDYLQSDHWAEVRQRVNEYWGHKCAVCNSPDNLRVHHRTYENMGQERIQDVILLCDDCHSKIHGKHNYRPEPIQVTLSRYIDKLTNG